MNQIINELKTLAYDQGILYVEDNKGLRDNIEGLLAKFFPKVWVAEEGRSGYELYLTHRPAIVLTDINMPHMKGFELARAIKADNNDVRIIILSAFDEKEYLYEAIEIGIFRYLPKPAKVPILVTVLRDTALAIQNERNKRIFDSQLKDIFHYQNNLLLMLKGEEPLLVNQQVLDFFGDKNFDQFMQQHGGIEKLLLEHKGFLYSTAETRWYTQAIKNPGKLFHTKMFNHAGEVRHLIMKLRLIPDKEGYTILSFDDITDLNLLMIFDSKSAKNDQLLQERSVVVKLLKVIQDNSAEVKLYNFYRGLTIINTAVLIKIDDNEMTLKTTYSQLKAIKLANNITVTSELFPSSILCKSVKSIDFDAQTVTFSDVKFIDSSADQRQFIRLEPNEKRHSVTFFYREIKFYGKARIVDISICSIKIEIDALPAGLCVGETIKVALVLDTDKQPLNFSVSGNIYRIDSFTKNYYLITLFDLSSTLKEKLTDYLATRQLELIREFKAL